MRLLGTVWTANWTEYASTHKPRVAHRVRHGEVHHRPLFRQRQQQWERHRLRKCSTTGPSSEPYQPSLYNEEQQPQQQQQQQQQGQGQQPGQQVQQPLQWQQQEGSAPPIHDSEPTNQPRGGKVMLRTWVVAVLTGQWLLQPPPPPPVVPPWGLSVTVTLMTFWMLGFWLAASSGVPALVGLLGLDSAGSSARVKAFKHLLLDVFQLLLTLGTLWLGLRQYSPRSLGFFSFSLHPWRSWLGPLLAGLASFPVVDWVYKHLIGWLNLGDTLLAGTVEEIATTSDWGAHAVWFAVLAICAPVWEEIMFRGFLLPSLTKYLPQWGAVLASALVFSLVHFTKDGFLPLLLLGLVFGAVYVQTRNLWPPILLHAVWNVILLQQIRASGTGL